MRQYEVGEYGWTIPKSRCTCSCVWRWLGELAVMKKRKPAWALRTFSVQPCCSHLLENSRRDQFEGCNQISCCVIGTLVCATLTQPAFGSRVHGGSAFEQLPGKRMITGPILAYDVECWIRNTQGDFSFLYHIWPLGPHQSFICVVTLRNNYHSNERLWSESTYLGYLLWDTRYMAIGPKNGSSIYHISDPNASTNLFQFPVWFMRQLTIKDQFQLTYVLCELYQLQCYFLDLNF